MSAASAALYVAVPSFPPLWQIDLLEVDQIGVVEVLIREHQHILVLWIGAEALAGIRVHRQRASEFRVLKLRFWRQIGVKKGFGDLRVAATADDVVQHRP